MIGYSTGEVERLLALPASTLRFWEKEVAFLDPRKDHFGRRVYGPADLCVLSRLKHLALDKGLGLSAACRAIEHELMNGDSSRKAELNQLRIGIFGMARELELLRDRANALERDAGAVQPAAAAERSTEDDRSDQEPM